MPAHANCVLSRRQVREVDRRAIEDYGIPGVVIMENAGRNAAELILSIAPHMKLAAILCGGGNNGGDGFVIARHLHNAGRQVQIVLTCPPESLAGDAAINYAVAKKMRLSIKSWSSAIETCDVPELLSQSDVIVDALLGTGFQGEVRMPMNRIIDAINESGCPNIFAIDVPSGLDCDTGRASAHVVRAHHTITFVANKIGFKQPGVEAFTGIVHVADIGAPAEILDSVLAGYQP